MKLREVLAEMSMPAIRSPEEAVKNILAAYNSAVVRKQPNGDLYGPLTASLRYLQNSTNPEKYQREIKKGLAAKKSMDLSRKTLSKTQAQFTSVK